MNILSLFDGISCGQVALERAGINIDKYFASEIDKYAIKITQKNYSNTIQLGDINNWQTWKLPKIDLLIGGSPCQGFSFAGKQLNFEDPRSKLLFKFVDILKYYKPKYFLLENVKMKKEYQNVISEALGVEPIQINSALVSAQSRNRLYWSNIQDINQPEDKNILLKDIIENHVDKKYFTKMSFAKRFDYTIHEFPYNKKAQCLRATDYKGTHNLIKINGKIRRLTPIECERLQTVPDNYTEGVSNTQRYKMLGNGWTVDVVAHIFKNLS